MTGRITSQKCAHTLRLIELWDDKKNDSVYFLTNNFKLAAMTIASAYKARWDIESFFKLIKQNLKIKAFYSTSENAVKAPIWTAIFFTSFFPISNFRQGMTAQYLNSAESFETHFSK
jgi:IS4 transposase